MTAPRSFQNFITTPVYQTTNGRAYAMDSLELMKSIPDESIDAIITSPPYALIKKKEYGNEDAERYVNWFLQFAAPFRRILKERGSLVLNIGGAYERGQPTRSLCHFEVMLRLCKEFGFHLAQEFYWFNPAKMPAPAEWVTIQRMRVRDSVEPVWWLSKNPKPKANNRNVLTPYGKHMRDLLQKGYNAGFRPSGHVVSDQWGKDLGGAIPSNVFEIIEPPVPEDQDKWQNFFDDYFTSNVIKMANTSATDRYRRLCKERGILYPHPATFPTGLPQFFVKFLTEPGDVVFDPFGGSGTTALAAEAEGRQWITCDLDRAYVVTSKFRFPALDNQLNDEIDEIATAHAEVAVKRKSKSRAKRRVNPEPVEGVTNLEQHTDAAPDVAGVAAAAASARVPLNHEGADSTTAKVHNGPAEHELGQAKAQKKRRKGPPSS